MATTKTDNVTLLDASPRLTMEVGTVNGKVRVFQDTGAVAAADFDADGDVIYLAEVPSGAKIVSIKVANDGLEAATAGTVNIGLYNGPSAFTSSTGTSYAADGLIDEDAYATAVTSFQTGGAAMTEYAFEARNINAINNYVWEDAGLPENPGVPLRIGATQTATTTFGKMLAYQKIPVYHFALVLHKLLLLLEQLVTLALLLSMLSTNFR